MDLRKWLLGMTEVYELCVICENGWIVAACWIDDEDLFIHHVDPALLCKKVERDEWGTLPIWAGKGSDIKVPCHYVYV